MSVSSAEIKNRVAGLSYVARTSRNHELAEEAKQQIVAIYQSLDGSKQSLIDYVESHLAEFTPVPAVRDRTGSGASDIADMLEEASTSYNTAQTLVIYIFFVLTIALYISSINNSLSNIAFRKN